jgi:hypothetical protein
MSCWSSQGLFDLLTFICHVEGLKAKITAVVGSFSVETPAAVIEFCRRHQMLMDMEIERTLRVQNVCSAVRSELAGAVHL